MKKATDSEGNEYVALNLADAQLATRYMRDEAFRYFKDDDKGPYFYNAKVSRVVDGDTVDVELDLGFEVMTRKRIRVYGINTPETRTRDKTEKARGIEAKNMLNHLNKLFGPTVFLASHGRGKYGRTLGDLWFQVDAKNWINYSQLMVGEGLAEPYFGESR